MPHNLYAKMILDEGILGKVTLMRVRNAHNGTSKNWLPVHFYDPVTCGGGAMMDLGAHPMYLINWLMGRPKTMSSTFTSVYGHAVEDNAVSVMAFDNGAIAISETGFVSQASSPISLELYGTEGALFVGSDFVKLHATWEDLPTKYKGHIDEFPEALPSPIQQFVAEMRGDFSDRALFGIHDAVTLTEMMEAAYTSYREVKQVLL